MAKQHDKQFKLDAVQYYQDHKDLGVRGCAENYNSKRIHSHCNYMSPNEFERVYERTHTEAELLAG